jgi:RNA polymerase sigma-70 factor (ECF subfamily)
MAPSARTDAELLARASTDVNAFDEFYRRYEPIVVGFIRRRVRDAETTADLTADTFVVALRSADRFQDNGRPAAGWILGIANNVVRTAHRRSRVEQRAFERIAFDRPQHSAASLEAVDRLLDLQAGRNPLLAALAELPEEQRDAVRAYILDERPYREIAEALGVKEGTLRQRVRRGLNALRGTTQEASS